LGYRFIEQIGFMKMMKTNKNWWVALTAMLATVFACGPLQAQLVFEGEKGPGKGKHIVLIAGDEEYRSEESCPMLAKILAKHHGFKASVVFSINPDGGYVDPNYQENLTGMEAVNTADLVIIGTRFRRPADEELKPLADYLKAGKPIMGFRTATHGFTGDSTYAGIKWSQFGQMVLGEGWAGHYGKHKKEGALGRLNPAFKSHPLLNGVSDFFGESDVYGVKAVTDKNAKILAHGIVTETLWEGSKEVAGKDPQPCLWVKDYQVPGGKKGEAICTTFGSSCDLDDENLRRVFINAAYYSTGLDVPKSAKVDYVDPFTPSAFLFNKGSDYYKNLNYKPEDYGWGKSPQTGPKMDTLTPADQAPKAKKAAAAITPGTKKKTSDDVVDESEAESEAEIVPTPIAIQQRDRKRPLYVQPKALSGAPVATTLPLNPVKGETIAFIGNCLPERMQHFGHFEALLHGSMGDKIITLRNMGFPAHTPGFRPEAGQPNPWAFPGAEKFRPEINGHNGKGHYPMPDEWLTIIEADTIVAFFGFNESFDGEAGVDNFKAELSAFVDHTLTRAYNQKAAPKLVLATPIAMEQHKGYFLPDAGERNRILKMYADAVKSVASTKKVGFIDLFSPTQSAFATSGNSDPLTINGIHLSDAGYKMLAPKLMKALFGSEGTAAKNEKLLRDVVTDKNWFWRNDYRMLNGVHAYGQRWAPYGNFNYPEEIEKIRQMTVLRDENIWNVAAGKSSTLEVADEKTRPLTPVVSNYEPSEKNGTLNYLPADDSMEKFKLPEGYKVNLFASEADFPNLQNPAQMMFDNKGRLWVSVVPSYPHYKPGGKRPDDKLLIYEDTDGDGRADKETVFADKLHIPIGFELAPEGVYISEEPYLTLHKDTDGDGKADTKDYLLDGFDPHDTHHAISAFNTDNGGGIFMCEGRFLHSQVETPYGPQRMSDGGVWRFDPKSWRVNRFIQTDVSNPWAVTHDEYGQNFLNDASGGNHYWMLPLSVKVPHGHEISKVQKFNYEHHARPSSGGEFIHSRHFPDEVQGDYIYCNSIGFLGIKQYQTVEDGIAIRGKHRQDLIFSTDGNCRPADLEMAPDGSLYFIDWHNTLIGHMQHNARDPKRNSDYGRIFRITYPSRPLVKPAEIDGASIATLFENMKLPELQSRKRSHRELRGRDADEVIEAAFGFAEKNAADERLVLEALWATWGHQRPSRMLIEELLKASDYRVRCAAVRVVRHSMHLLDTPVDYLMQAAVDEHGRVRLEALAAATWWGGKEAAEVLLIVASQPSDKWTRTSLNSAILLLKDDVETLLDNGTVKRDDIADLDKLLASKLPGAVQRKSVLTKGVDVKSRGARDFKASYQLGSEAYHKDGACMTCHLENGQGTEIYPPLVGSEWVTGDTDRLIKIILKGLWGKIEVNGKVYDPAKGVPPMTAFGAMLSDAEVAGVANFIRHSWGNNAGEVSAAQVKAVRNDPKVKAQQMFYSPEELLKMHPMKEK